MYIHTCQVQTVLFIILIKVFLTNHSLHSPVNRSYMAEMTRLKIYIAFEKPKPIFQTHEYSDIHDISDISKLIFQYMAHFTPDYM